MKLKQAVFASKRIAGATADSAPRVEGRRLGGLATALILIGGPLVVASPWLVPALLALVRGDTVFGWELLIGVGVTPGGRT